MTSEVSKCIHVDHPQHSVEMENTEVLTTEHRWIERGVKEENIHRALSPNLIRDGGRYNLPPVWDNIIKKKVKADRSRRVGVGSSSSNTEVLTTEHRWIERGVKEENIHRALSPNLIRDGGRYNLPPVWDNIIKKKVKADRSRRVGVGSSSSSRTTSPTTFN